MTRHVSAAFALLILAAILLIAAAAAWWPSARPAPAHIRTVAFDNTYGATILTVHVRVDGGAEQAVTASCDPTTCTFALPLTNAPHALTLSVEQDGKRSAPAVLSIATSDLDPRPRPGRRKE